MKVAWGKGIIPKAWQRAGEILIFKEKNSSTISQFHQISLLNVERKIFVDVVAQRLSIFAERQLRWHISAGGWDMWFLRMSGTCKCHLAPDTNCQEGKEPCMWFSSILPMPLHRCLTRLWTAFNFVPEGIRKLVKAYFQDLIIHHSVHHSSITMGGQRGTLEEWAVFSSNRGVHGWYDHNNTNKSMSPTACWINFKETSNGHESNTADPAVFSVSKAGSQTKDSASMISQYQLSWRSPSKASDDGTT